MLSDRDYMRSSPDPRSYRGQQKTPSILKNIIILNCVIFFLGALSPGFNDFLMKAFQLDAPSIKGLQLWRLISYMFLHGGLGHLFFNMWGLYIFGRLIERPLGEKRFLTLYLLSGVIGGLLWLFANWNVYFGCIGASGALFGVLVAAAMAHPNATFAMIFPPIVIRLKTLAIIYCVIEIISLPSQSSSGIAHLAHLGGALGGFLFMRRLGVKISFNLQDKIKKIFNKIPAGNKQKNIFKNNKSTDTPLDTEELDRVLDKISQVGYDNLSENEKETLRIASQRLRNR
jgi:membrane associated rhomboid family serine protease